MRCATLRCASGMRWRAHAAPLTARSLAPTAWWWSRAYAATAAAAATGSATTAVRSAPLAVNFADVSSYRTRSTWYLLKALLILKLCSIPFFALNSVALMHRTEKVLGKTLTYQLLVKRTIYNYFCAGENEAEVRCTIRALEQANIGAILDYAAEADVEGFAPAPGQAEAPELSMARLVNKCNVHYADKTGSYDENMKLYMLAVMHATLHTPAGRPGMMAVKFSGMCDPQLLARMSAMLMSIHQSWCCNFTQEPVPKLEECRVVMGVSRKHQLYITPAQLRSGFDRLDADRRMSDDEFAQVLRELDVRQEGRISYFDYKQLLSDAVIAVAPTPVQRLLIARLPALTAEEKTLWEAMCRRVDLIASTAKELNVRMLVDAEQTFYQLAIDALVSTLQRRYNTQVPVVYNTYQCYLTYAEDRIANDLARAEQHGYQWGGKVVRGAYLLQERQTAQQYNYASPVWSTYEETNACYDACAMRILDSIAAAPQKQHEAFFGTHNRHSLEVITGALLHRGEVHRRVAFGQLYGMRDNLTVPLAKAGFRAYKYVPYGPVRETVHYLGRRAVENSAILTGKDAEEVSMMRRELMRRCLLRQ